MSFVQSPVFATYICVDLSQSNYLLSHTSNSFYSSTSTSLDYFSTEKLEDCFCFISSATYKFSPVSLVPCKPHYHSQSDVSGVQYYFNCFFSLLLWFFPFPSTPIPLSPISPLSRLQPASSVNCPTKHPLPCKLL